MHRLLQIGGIFLLASACGNPEAADGEVEDFVDAGHIRFYSPPDKPVCAGTPKFLDDMLSRLGDYLGMPLPERIDYHYHPDPDLSQVCGTAVSYAACSFPGEKRIWARDATSVHEIVHALADQDGEHYSFLAEGLATALGDGNISLADYDADESTYLTSFEPSRNAGLAGDLVSYLLTKFGVSQFMDLYARVSPRATAEDFKDEFKAVYELDFDEVLTQRRDATSRFRENRLRFPECSLPVVDWDGDLWSATNDVDCDASGIGPSTSLSVPATAWLGQNLEIAEDGIFEITFSGSSGGGAHLYHCEPPYDRWSLTDPWQPVVEGTGRRSLTYGRLAAGRYAVLSNTEERHEPASISVTLARSAPSTASCDEQTPLSVPDGIGGLYLLSEPDAPTERTFELQSARFATGLFTEAELCDAQCGACAAPPEFEPLTLTPGVTYSLRVPAQAYRQAQGIQLLAQ